MRCSLCLCLFLVAATVATAAEPDYTKDIRPLLAEKCATCHGALKQEAGLRLDAGALIHQGGDSGAVVAPSEPDTSELIRRVTAADLSERMPPEGEGEPLTEEQVGLLRGWIAAGAAYPDDESIPADPREHWAYQPVQRPAVPSDVPEGWSEHPIDAFIAAGHHAQGLTPLEPADKRTLLRRVALDLVGLPPTPDEQHAFLANESRAAYEELVDRYLASPEHAQRWARHWMDVWRYSDWDGYKNELRGSQRHLWRWRDWIVDSLHEDKPYDQMIVEMLAGDEIAPTDENVLRATGFLGRQHYRLNRDLWLDNTVEHTFKAFVGVTINCAKCHDHKYDPIAQSAYYRARAIFEPYKVRIDRIPGEPDTDKDGLTRSYDAEPEATTYVYVRGNEKHPDKEHPVEPGLPAVFGTDLACEPVELPVEAWYPDLREHVVAERLAAARKKVDDARQAQQEAERGHQAAAELLAAVMNEQPPEPQAETTLWRDDFTSADSELWTLGNGAWSYSEQGLHQDEVAKSRSEIVSRRELPRDVVVRVRFRILGGETYHSVGLSFDVRDDDRSEGVYLSAHPPGPKVQAVHQRQGQSSYPAEGRASLPVALDQEYLLEVALRDRLLNVAVDGKHVFAYRLPDARRAGRLALWSFDTRADFREVSVAELPAGRVLHGPGATPSANTPESAAVALENAKSSLDLAQLRVSAADAEFASLEARLQADRAALTDRDEALDRAAALAERTHTQSAAEVKLAEAEQKVVEAQRAETDDEKTKKAVEDAVKTRDAAAKALDDARKAVEESSTEYTPFGTKYPRTSTGRRLALAQWIASPDNPLTPRVAVNQIWMRHFGSPLVANVFDFGLNSDPPVHRDVLDWLAAEFIESGWSMRHVHRLIVTSRTYQLASASGHDAALIAANAEIDPDNAYYWRANIRRLDAEVVRDSVLYVAGNLDRSQGGPDIDFNEGEKVTRRSLYFRHAYEKQMRFLVLFDAASPNDCYRRTESIIPQQALALANSTMALRQSRHLAASLSESVAMNAPAAFVEAAFERVLARLPSEEERQACVEFLATQVERLTTPADLTEFAAGAEIDVAAADDPAQRAREDLIHVLMNHNDFVTVR